MKIRMHNYRRKSILHKINRNVELTGLHPISIQINPKTMIMQARINEKLIGGKNESKSRKSKCTYSHTQIIYKSI